MFNVSYYKFPFNYFSFAFSSVFGWKEGGRENDEIQPSTWGIFEGKCTNKNDWKRGCISLPLITSLYQSQRIGFSSLKLKKNLYLSILSNFNSFY